MVLRDLRKAFRTYLTNAKVPEPTIRRLMGHSVDVSQGYHELTEEAAREAILVLKVPESSNANPGLRSGLRSIR
jgi:integrase